MTPRRALSSTVSSAPKPKIDLILDSGAYSAWKLGKPVDIDKYCDYLLANQEWIGHSVALDVINPGRPEEAAAASFENLIYMRKKGLRPVPVFHVGEDISWLFRMLDLGCDYIGLSASSLVSRNKVDDWYELAWSYLTTPSGAPIVKAHAFGEGRRSSMLRFPWYSADSTSWVYDAQRNGAMTLEGGRKIAHRNDGAHDSSVQDIEFMAPEDRATFYAELARAGIDPSGFAERGSYESTVLRTYLAMLDCARTQAIVRKAQPIRCPRTGLFLPPCRWTEADARPETAFKFFLVIGGNPVAAACLAYGGYENALVSYFYVGQAKPGEAEPMGKSFAPKRGQGNNGNYGRIKDFVLDPVGMCASQVQFAKAFDVLKRFVQPQPSAA